MFQPPRDPYERKFKDIQAALKNQEQRIVDLQKHAATPRLPASARSDATRQAYLETMRDFQRTNESYVNIISLLGFGRDFARSPSSRRATSRPSGCPSWPGARSCPTTSPPPIP